MGRYALEVVCISSFRVLMVELSLQTGVTSYACWSLLFCALDRLPSLIINLVSQEDKPNSLIDRKEHFQPPCLCFRILRFAQETNETRESLERSMPPKRRHCPNLTKYSCCGNGPKPTSTVFLVGRAARTNTARSGVRCSRSAASSRKTLCWYKDIVFGNDRSCWN